MIYLKKVMPVLDYSIFILAHGAIKTTALTLSFKLCSYFARL